MVMNGEKFCFIINSIPTTMTKSSAKVAKDTSRLFSQFWHMSLAIMTNMCPQQVILQLTTSIRITIGMQMNTVALPNRWNISYTVATLSNTRLLI